LEIAVLAVDVFREHPIGKTFRFRRSDFNGDAIVRDFHPAFPVASETLYLLKIKADCCSTERQSQTLHATSLSRFCL
jgi:hypothetical protein